MKNIHSTYEFASSQAIGLPKSEVFYRSSVQTPLKNIVTSILGVLAVMGTSKYLGLPSMVGQSKESTFGFIKDLICDIK